MGHPLVVRPNWWTREIKFGPHYRTTIPRRHVCDSEWQIHRHRTQLERGTYRHLGCCSRDERAHQLWGHGVYKKWPDFFWEVPISKEVASNTPRFRILQFTSHLPTHQRIIKGPRHWTFYWRSI